MIREYKQGDELQALVIFCGKSVEWIKQNEFTNTTPHVSLIDAF